MKSAGSLPRRYAKALFRLALETKTVDVMGQDLESFYSELSQFPKAVSILSNDLYSHRERAQALTEITGRLQIKEILKNFLLLLLNKGRFQILPQIVLEYSNLSDELLNILRIKITTPDGKDEALASSIKQLLESKLKMNIMSSGESDPDMLGGVILKINHTHFDGSLRRDLERIKENMMKS